MLLKEKQLKVVSSPMERMKARRKVMKKWMKMIMKKRRKAVRSKCDQRCVVFRITCGRSMSGELLLFVFVRDEQKSESKARHKKVTFNLLGDEASEGEDMEDIFGGKAPNKEKSEPKSSFEKRQEKVTYRFILLLHFWLNHTFLLYHS